MEAPPTNPAVPCSRNRHQHRHAVVREIPLSAATCATARPDPMRWTMINLPAGVSRALAWDTRDLRGLETEPRQLQLDPGGLSYVNNDPGQYT